jgi:hypothetical protein
MRHLPLRIAVLLGVIVMVSGCSDDPPPAQDTIQPTTTEVSVNPAPASPTPAEPATKPEETKEVTLTDIAGHPVEKEIVKLVEAGAVEIGSDGRFRPDDEITRGEFLEWMYRYDPKDVKPFKPDRPSFSDLSAASPYFEMVEGMKAANRIIGLPDQTIRVEKKLTREELTMFWAWYHQMKMVMEQNPLLKTVLKGIVSDYDDIGEPYIYSMSVYSGDYREVFGKTPKMMPKSAVSRAEAAQWIVTKTKEEGDSLRPVRVVVEGEAQVEQKTEAIDLANHSAKSAIEKLLEKGVVKTGSDGKFRPDEPISRGDFIQWMYTLDSKGIKPHKPDTQTFSDLPPDHPLYPLVEGLKTSGVIIGFPDGTIKTDNALTREELALLWGWYQQESNVVRPYGNFLLLIRDVKDKDSIGKDFVYAVTHYRDLYRKIFKVSSTFKPQQVVTRAEAAQWMIQSLTKN